MTPTRAVAYTRMHGFTKQDSERFDAHLDAIRAHADANGYRLTRSYRDFPEGHKIRNPKLARLKADARKGKFDVVLVYDRRQLCASWWQRWLCMLTLWLRTGVTVRPLNSRYGRWRQKLAGTTKPVVAREHASAEEWAERWKLEPIELHLWDLSELTDNEPVQRHSTMSKKSPDERSGLRHIQIASVRDGDETLTMFNLGEAGDISEPISLHNMAEDKD